jgi:hypothetical protein
MAGPNVNPQVVGLPNQPPAAVALPDANPNATDEVNWWQFIFFVLLRKFVWCRLPAAIKGFATLFALLLYMDAPNLLGRLLVYVQLRNFTFLTANCPSFLSLFLVTRFPALFCLRVCSFVVNFINCVVSHSPTFIV